MPHSGVLFTRSIALVVASLALTTTVLAQGPDPKASKKKPDFPPFAKVAEGFKKIETRDPSGKSMWNLWVKEKDNQILAELPRGYNRSKYFIATTISSGERFAGLQAGDFYVYWKRIGKRLALIQPNLAVRSSGDKASRSSVDRLFTDQVLLDIPIVAMSPSGGTVIDLNGLLVGKATDFFGFRVAGLNSRLVTFDTEKDIRGFPQNIEIALTAPIRGNLQKLHYSISVVPKKTGYKPRMADPRIGYFTTSFQDLGKYSDDEKWQRYITRWHLEKADPKLKLSPPKKPIVFYVEHTTPIRYRRFVADGILSWNEAFEGIGILNAIEVRFQDSTTGAYMDVDPEDVRYNFVRWLNNDVSTAIGPSRVHPETGQILDADIILTDGWIRTFEYQFSKLLPELAMDGMSAESLAWLDENPDWDPRIRAAEPADRENVYQRRLAEAGKAYGGHPLAGTESALLGDEEGDGLVDRLTQVNGFCRASGGKAFDLGLLRMQLDFLGSVRAEDDEDGEGDSEPQGDILDGIPAEFIGPLLADLVAHEVGHTLGLRHNFKASTLYSLDEINSPEVAGKKPFTASVMDYSPININMDEDAIQGDYAMIGVGPYDMWAIEYGYTLDNKALPKILGRCTEPENQYATDEDTSGPDPRARRYDFTRDPLDYAMNQIELAAYHRERLIDKFVKDGESWSKARRGYDMTLSTQARALFMMANWIGGSFLNRDRKGDGDRAPIEPIPVEDKREALEFCLENGFEEDAYGVTPELLRYLGLDVWLDGSMNRFSDPAYPINDRVLGVQATLMTLLLNPTTLRRVFDSESRVDEGQDCLTLTELLSAVGAAAWSELESAPSGGSWTDRNPMISNIRRNLQREHVERLIDLSSPSGRGSTASRAVSSLVRLELRELTEKIESTLDRNGDIDRYTRAHLVDVLARVNKALEASATYEL